MHSRKHRVRADRRAPELEMSAGELGYDFTGRQISEEAEEDEISAEELLEYAAHADREHAVPALIYDPENDLILVSLTTVDRLMHGDRKLQKEFKRFAGKHPTANVMVAGFEVAPANG